MLCTDPSEFSDYEAIFYGAMSSNHPEMMRTYPNPLLDFIPSAEQYAIERSRASLNRSCSGLYFPHVLAPWGVPQYSSPYPNYSDREATMSSGPVSERVVPQKRIALHCIASPRICFIC